MARRLEIDRRSPRVIVTRALRRLRDVGFHGWRDDGYVSETAPVIIGGCGRSGTTLLRHMLNRHPRVGCGAETRLFLGQWPNVEWLSTSYGIPKGDIQGMMRTAPSRAAFIDAFFRRCCREWGKPRWAEKTPRNVRYVDDIFRHFPLARFVHVIRDGRDTVCSLRVQTRDALVRGTIVKREAVSPLDLCIERWRDDVTAGLRHRDDPRYFEVRYEDLVADPCGVLRRLTRFIDEDCPPEVLLPRDATADPAAAAALRPVYTASVGRWRRDLAPDEIRQFDATAGRLRTELGYGS